MDVLDIRRADGSRGKVTLRRFVREGHRFSTPGHVAHEFEILRLVERAAVPAPRPILLDSEGHYFGVPAIVMSYLPGRPLFPTTNLGNWTRGLADVLWQLHNVRDRSDSTYPGCTSSCGTACVLASSSAGLSRWSIRSPLICSPF